MAKSDPSNPRWIDHSCNRLAQHPETGPITGGEQERLVIPNQEEVELQIDFGGIQAEPKNVRSNLHDLRQIECENVDLSSGARWSSAKLLGHENAAHRVRVRGQ